MTSHYMTLHGHTLDRITWHDNSLHYITLHPNPFRDIARHCMTMPTQFLALHIVTLRCVPLCHITLHTMHYMAQFALDDHPSVAPGGSISAELGPDLVDVGQICPLPGRCLLKVARYCNMRKLPEFKIKLAFCDIGHIWPDSAQNWPIAAQHSSKSD